MGVSDEVLYRGYYPFDEMIQSTETDLRRRRGEMRCFIIVMELSAMNIPMFYIRKDKESLLSLVSYSGS
jgi:hypothetical protein